jgi:murein DD-endopeptidase MepM/ murein hydrolase activator NlpD
METVSRVSKQAALDDEDLMDAVGRLTRVTGDAARAQNDLSIAANIARGRNIDLSAAVRLVEQAEFGRLGALRRVGIDLQPVTAAQDALRASGEKVTFQQREQAKAADELATKQAAIAALQQQYAGAAERYGNTAAGAQDRFRVAVENLQESIGRLLLPVVERAARRFAGWAEELEENEQLQRDVADAARDAARLIGDVVDAADDAADAVGGWRNAMELLLALAVAAKLAAWTSALQKLIGTAAVGGAVAGGTGLAGAAGGAATLRTRLLALARLPALAIPILILVNGREIDDYLKNELGPLVRALQEGDWRSFLFGGFFNEIGKGQAQRDARGGAAFRGGGFVGASQALVAGASGAISPFPRGTSTRSGGGPEAHGARAFGNWQSDQAFDIHVKPGTPVLAVVGGNVLKVRINPATTGSVYGDQVTIQGTDGNGWFYTHIRTTVRAGQKVSKGQVIGTVSPWSGDPHLHIASDNRAALNAAVLGKAAALPAFGKSTPGVRPGGGTAGGTDTGGGGGGGGGAPDPPRAAPLIPFRLEEALTTAEGTKGARDDIAAYRAIIKYLDDAIDAERNIEKRIGLRRELNQANRGLADLLQPGDKKKKADRDPDDDPLLEKMLLRYDQALLTKKLDDDIRTLDQIIAYLDKRYEREKNITEKRRLLADLKGFRQARESAVASRSQAASGKATAGARSEVEELIGRGIPRPGEAAILFEPRDFSTLSAEKQEKMAKISADLAIQIKPLKDYWQQLFNKQKAIKAKRAAVQRTLDKLNRVPARLRDRAWSQRRLAAQNEIKILTGLITDLQKAMDEVAAAILDLDATAHSEILRIANEADEQADAGSTPSAGTSAPEPSGPDTTPFSQAEVDRLTGQNVVGFLTGVSALRQYQSNVYGDVFDQLNPLAALGGSNLLVNNYFLTNPADPHSFSKGIEFELRAALGA